MPGVILHLQSYHRLTKQAFADEAAALAEIKRVEKAPWIQPLHLTTEDGTLIRSFMTEVPARAEIAAIVKQNPAPVLTESPAIATIHPSRPSPTPQAASPQAGDKLSARERFMSKYPGLGL